MSVYDFILLIKDVFELKKNNYNRKLEYKDTIKLKICRF